MHALDDDDYNPRSCELCDSDDIATEVDCRRPYITERTCRDCGFLWKIAS